MRDFAEGYLAWNSGLVLKAADGGQLEPAVPVGNERSDVLAREHDFSWKVVEAMERLSAL